MKNALIAPMQSPIEYISGWTDTNPTEPIYTQIADSCRVAEVSNVTFEVSPPLFWTECDDNVVADQFYYNTGDNEIYPVPDPAPKPVL
jgi:hypothetical protein